MSEMILAENAAAQKASLHAQVAPKAWRFVDLPSVQAALDFVNAAPAQGAGEISAVARNDGTVGMFYFL